MFVMRGAIIPTSDVNTIVELYVTKEQSAIQIGKQYGISVKTILKILRANGATIRNGVEAPRISGQHRSLQIQKQFGNKINQLYRENHLTEREIEQRLHIGTELISKCLKQSNSLRTPHESAILRGNTGEKEKHSQWKGRRKSKGYYYVYCPSHPRAKKKHLGGYIPEHVAVWEEMHGKYLPEGWIVHHLNGIRSDNRPSNLVALPNRKHNRLIHEYMARLRQLEIENRQLRRALEDGQMIFTFNDN